MILAKYLNKHCNKIKAKHIKGKTLNVLEIGSGTGLLGIYAACLGWNVTLSDQAEITSSILAKNLEHNKEVILENDGQVKIVTLDW